MPHYILLQKDEPGAPLGFLPVILQDKFYENAKDNNYGNQPWYSGSGKKHLPDTPHIITELEDMQFDIRSGSDFFYIASDRFVDLCLSSGVDFAEKKPAKVLTTTGRELDMRYWACSINSHPIENATDPKKTIFHTKGALIQPEKIEIRNDFPFPLFKINNLSAAVDFIFCSPALKKKAETQGIRGAYFESTAKFKWSKHTDPMENYFLAAQGKLKLSLPV